ncbi:MAG: DNA starvation/stationary phase protection protein [Saprospiraceae bacterium]
MKRNLKEDKTGISKKDLESSIKTLTSVLSNEMILYTKTRNFHWGSVSGNIFTEIHRLFENQYLELAQVIDEVAERVKILGGQEMGTTDEFFDNATLRESTQNIDRDKMIAELLSDHEQVTTELRSSIVKLSETNDYGTIYFLTGLALKHESKTWILRKHIN